MGFFVVRELAFCLRDSRKVNRGVVASRCFSSCFFGFCDNIGCRFFVFFDGRDVGFRRARRFFVACECCVTFVFFARILNASIAFERFRGSRLFVRERRVFSVVFYGVFFRRGREKFCVAFIDIAIEGDRFSRFFGGSFVYISGVRGSGGGTAGLFRVYFDFRFFVLIV